MCLQVFFIFLQIYFVKTTEFFFFFYSVLVTNLHDTNSQVKLFTKPELWNTAKWKTSKHELVFPISHIHMHINGSLCCLVEIKWGAKSQKFLNQIYLETKVKCFLTNYTEYKLSFTYYTFYVCQQLSLSVCLNLSVQTKHNWDLL